MSVGWRSWATARDIAGPGFAAYEGGTVVARSRAVERAPFAGAVAAGGSLTLLDCAISDTRADASLGGGVGVWAGDVDGGSFLTLDRCDVRGSPWAALWIASAASVDVEDSLLTGGGGVGGCERVSSSTETPFTPPEWQGGSTDIGANIPPPTFRPASADVFDVV